MSNNQLSIKNWKNYVIEMILYWCVWVFKEKIVEKPFNNIYLFIIELAN